MNWKLEVDEHLKIIVLTYTGKNTGADILNATNARIELVKQTGISKLLIDATKVQVDNSETVDIYNLADKTYSGSKETRKMKMAITIPEHPPSTEMVYFYETVCVNRGFNVKVMRNKEEALKWLLS